MNKVGVVIPCFNNLNVLKKSIPTIYSDDFIIVVFNDNSTDGTSDWLKKNFPKIIQLKGDGNNWWTGSLAKGIQKCIDNDCIYIMSVNADVLVSPELIYKLIETSKTYNNSVIASLVVEVKNPNKILWGGSYFKKIHSLIPIYSSKYIVKSGNDIKSIASKVYETDEVHGRGVLIPSKVIKEIGNYDYKNFPHYGGDNDFSLRLKNKDIKMYVDPSCMARVFSDNTSLNIRKKMSLSQKFIGIYRYLFVRKNGEALFVWFKLYKKHLSFKYFIQSYVFIILLNLYRKLLN